MLLKQIMKAFGAVVVKGEWRSPCILCQPEEQNEDKYKFVINPGTNRLIVCRCFNCYPDDSSDRVQWWAEICRQVRLPTESYQRYTTEEIRTQWQQFGWVYGKAEPKRYTLEVIDFIYNKLLSLLDLSTEHGKWLSDRGLDAETAYKIGYRSSPESTDSLAYLLYEQYPQLLEAVPGFHDGRLFMRQKAIVSPCRNTKNQIFSLKQRLLDGKGNRIRVLSSSKEGGLKAINGCHCPMGVGDYSCNRLWITEGERKADVWWNKSNNPTVAVPGVNALDDLQSVTATLLVAGGTAVVAMDNDEAGRKATKTTIALLQKWGYKTEVAKWDENVKGLDDAFVAGIPITCVGIDFNPAIQPTTTKAKRQNPKKPAKTATVTFIKNEQLVDWIRQHGPVLRASVNCYQPHLSKLIRAGLVKMQHSNKGQIVEVIANEQDCEKEVGRGSAKR